MVIPSSSPLSNLLPGGGPRGGGLSALAQSLTSPLAQALGLGSGGPGAPGSPSNAFPGFPPGPPAHANAPAHAGPPGASHLPAATAPPGTGASNTAGGPVPDGPLGRVVHALNQLAGHLAAPRAASAPLPQAAAAQDAAAVLQGLRGGLSPQGAGAPTQATTGAPFAAVAQGAPAAGTMTTAAPPGAPTSTAATAAPASTAATAATATAPGLLQAGILPPRGDAPAATARSAGEAALAANDRAAAAAALSASAPAGSTAATAAAATAAGATLAANPLAPAVVPLVDARGNPMLVGNDARPGQIGRPDGPIAQGHTVAGPARPGADASRRDRRDGWNGLLATLGAGSAAARAELADLREAELAYQWLYWVLTLAAYVALGLLLASAFVWLGDRQVPAGPLGQPSTMAWLVAIGLGCGVGAWRLAAIRRNRKDAG